jgi:hypothetical protein
VIGLPSRPKATPNSFVLKESFDLPLYKALPEVPQPDLHPALDELHNVETIHLTFWQMFFNFDLNELKLGQRITLSGMDVNRHILLTLSLLRQLYVSDMVSTFSQTICVGIWI